jgi:Phytanoyl-CoA dioxygenase (PhyH)
MIYPMQTTIATDDELGSLGVMHLKRLWSRYLAHRLDAAPPDEGRNEWAMDNAVISGLGLNLHETMRYLYANGPSFEQFEQWILERNGGSIEPARVERINAALNGNGAAPRDAASVEEAVLTPEDLAFWEENGYVIVHDAAPAEGCAAAVQAICEFLRMDLNDPNTWYNGPQGHSIWVPLVRHPAIEANRNSPRIRRAFEQIWGRADLWMTVDQCGMNPPEQPGWRFPGPHLHWDVSLALPIPFGVQGLVYLTDTATEQGAFTCVPGFHRKIESWLNGLPQGMNPRDVELDSLGPVAIPGQAGDLIIWHQALPHGSRRNRTTVPRFVQYMTMRPPDFETNPIWR